MVLLGTHGCLVQGHGCSALPCPVSPWFQFVATLVRNPALLCVDVSLMFSWSDPNFRKSESGNVWNGQQHSLCLLFKVPEC